jgi:sec-independent protein translocase protein TatB
VFGLSFAELCVLLMVAMVVLGPKELPRYLRKAGQMAGRLRRLAYEMREKSGIDEVLRTEGIDRDFAEFRKLARGEILGVASAVRSVAGAARIVDEPANAYTIPSTPPDAQRRLEGAAREREYPREGADSYGALPDTAVVYEGLLAASALADDSLYARGEPPNESAVPSGISLPADATSTP